MSEYSTLTDPETVENFLHEHPFLVDLLADTRERISKYFGTDTEVDVRVVTDPEAKSDEHLFIYIQTKLRPMEARARLRSLDDGWWWRAVVRAEGKMSIGLKYI